MRAICSSRSQKKVRRTKRNMVNRIVKKKCKKMGYLKNVAFLMDLLWLMPPPAYKVTRGRRRRDTYLLVRYYTVLS